jgi:hypothetical protein
MIVFAIALFFLFLSIPTSIGAGAIVESHLRTREGTTMFWLKQDQLSDKVGADFSWMSERINDFSS